MALLIAISVSLKYIKTNHDFPLYYCRTPYWMSLIIPDLAAIASELCNWTAPYYGCIYVLNDNVIKQ
jgi:hypothetical protein